MGHSRPNVVIMVNPIKYNGPKLAQLESGDKKK